MSRWRSVRPEDAGIGAAPHRWAKAASERSRWGLSPAVASSWRRCRPRLRAGPAVPGRPRRPAPGAGSRAGRVRPGAVASGGPGPQGGLGGGGGAGDWPGPQGRTGPDERLGLEVEQGLVELFGALESTPWSCSAAATRAFMAPRRATRSTRIISTWPSPVFGVTVAPARVARAAAWASIGSDLPCRRPRAAVRSGHLDHLQAVGAGEAGQASPKVPVPSTPTRATGPKRSAQGTKATEPRVEAGNPGCPAAARLGRPTAATCRSRWCQPRP
jgi:hypothetical protein